MDLALMEKLLVFPGCVVACIVIAVCARKLPFRRSMAPVFFTFAEVSFLLSSVYWLVYDMLRSEARMPFAANEFAEIAFFLLLASTLSVVFRGRFTAARRETLCTALFSAASTALWIAWSGEWIEDVLVGICFGYFLCVCVRSMKLAGVLSKAEWSLLGCLSALLLALQGLTFVLPQPWNKTADFAAYAVMFAVLLYGYGKLIRGLLRSQDAAGLVALSISCLGWATSTMYMSAGAFYLAAQLSCIVVHPLMLLCLLREEGDA